MSAQFGSINLVKLLVNSGASVNLPKADGGSPLTIASYHNSPEVVLFLLEHGADYNQRDGDNDTALDNAIKQNHAIVEQILRKFIGKDQVAINAHEESSST